MSITSVAKQVFILLIGMSLVSVYGQQQVQTMESIAFGGYQSPLVKVKKDGQDYFYHPEGEVWVDDTEDRAADLIVGMKNGHYGVLKEDGRLVVPFEYDRVKLETKYQGQWHKNTAYDYKFIVLTKDGKTGVADEDGRIVVTLVYADAKAIHRKAIAISEGNSWGWVSAEDGHILQAPQYEYVRDFISEDYVEIRNHEKAGLAKTDGKVIIPVEYDGYIGYVEAQERNYFAASKEGKTFLFDEEGRLVLSGLENVISLGDTFLVGFKENGLYGVIDPRTATRVTEAVYEKIENFTRGLSIAKKNGKFGVIDQKGNAIVDFNYDLIQFMNAAGEPRFSSVPMIEVPSAPHDIPPSEAVTRKRQHEAEIQEHPWVIQLTRDRAVGITDWNGKSVIPIGTYQRIQPHYHQGKTYYVVGKGNKIGVLDENGKEILPPIYEADNTYQFSRSDVEGLYEVYNRFISYTDGKNEDSYASRIGLFDLELRKVIVEPVEQDIHVLNRQFIKIRRKLKDYRYELLLYNIYESKFYPVSPDGVDFHLLNNGRIQVELENGLYRLTDLEGNLIYENPQWKKQGNYNLIRFPAYGDKHNGDFYHGLKKVYADVGNLFIDSLGKERRFEGVDQVDDFYEGVAIAAKKISETQSFSGFRYKKGLINRNGETLVPFEYDEVYANGKDADVLIFSRENANRLVKRDGTFILEGEFSYIESSSSNDNIIVAKDGKYGLADFEGNLLVQPLYDELHRNSDGENKPWPLMVKEEEWYYFVNKNGEKYPLRAKGKHY